MFANTHLTRDYPGDRYSNSAVNGLPSRHVKETHAAKNVSLTRRQIFVNLSSNPSQKFPTLVACIKMLRPSVDYYPTSKHFGKSKGFANTHWFGMYRCPFAMARSTLPRVERLRQVPE